jgi:SAM-dependent methyltransferase
MWVSSDNEDYTKVWRNRMRKIKLDISRRQFCSTSTRIEPSITDSRYLIGTFLSFHIGKIAEQFRIKETPLTILDVGCGLKPYRPYFGNADLYMGIDIAKKAVDVKAVAEHIPFREGFFTVILCTQVLEHLTSPRKALEEIYRVMKPKGKLILSTHGIWEEGHETPDLWRWTADGLTRMLYLAGFEIHETHSMDPFASMFQLIFLYAPYGKISRYLINPCLNTFAKLLNRIIFQLPFFEHKHPKIHVVHIIVASKN